MLNQTQLQHVEELDQAEGIRLLKNPLSHTDLIAAARRHFWVFLLCVSASGFLAFLFLAQATSYFTSSVSILIDAKNVGMTAATPLEGSLTFETGAVDSQLQILTSDRLASSVAQRLGLQNNIAFLDPEGSKLSVAVNWLNDTAAAGIRAITGSPTPPPVRDLPESIRLLLATITLQNNTKVQRVGRTYVFSIDYTDPDPVLAQSIAGQYANAYLEDQLDSKFDSTRRATNWMEERIRELRARSLAADESVQKYRAENNLFAVSGRLMDEQSLTDATTQLTSAKANLDTASAKYQRLKQIIDTQDLNGSLTESLSTPNVASLRAKYLESAKLASDISIRYGENHQAAVKARKDMSEYTRLIFDELKNLLPGYQSDVAIAETQVNSIQNSISQLRQASTANDSAMVKLRALEQEADTLKTLYSTFLQKSQELQQQQSFPVTDARIISNASTPLVPSSPKKLLVLVVALLLGGICGAAIAYLREWRDRGFRTPNQIRDELGLDFIANIPVITRVPTPYDARSSKRRDKMGSLENERCLISSSDPFLTKIVDEPFSQFSEAIRALRSKVTLAFPKKKGVVIGLVSMFPDEGKSTVAKNLASSLALQGTSTVLVDGDLRNPTLTNSLASGTRFGVIDLIDERVSDLEILRYEEETGLAFLPGALGQRRANDIFGGNKIRGMIENLHKKYDVVVIDFPPVGALTDALASTNLVDGYIFVVHWGKTPKSIVREFFDNNGTFAAKTIGVALNNVDLKKLGKYGFYQNSSTYAKYSEKYFRGSE